jgi:hypothetical protein
MSAPSHIGGMQVALWSPLDDRHLATGKTRHLVATQQVRSPSGLAICRETAESFFLFLCDAAWQPIADTWHQSLDAARAQAEFEFTNLSSTWVG